MKHHQASPTEKLDLVLNQIHRFEPEAIHSKLGDLITHISTIKGKTTHEDLGKNIVLIKNNITNTELIKILQRLVNDGYIEKVKSPDSLKEINSFYITTFDGVLFLDHPGGYVKQAALYASENIRIDKLESDQRESQKNLVRLTSWIAWGTVGAAVIGLALLAWQIYVFYHPAPIPVDVKIKTEKHS